MTHHSRNIQTVIMHTSQEQTSRCRFHYRHPVFKIGVAGIALSTIIFIVGFSAPAWINCTGLWTACNDSAGGGSHRFKLNVYYVSAWLETIQAIESLALISFLLSMTVEVYQDFYKIPPPMENKLVEILAFIAGLLGITGVIIFGAKAQDINEYFQLIEISTGVYGKQRKPSYSGTINWGFGVSAVSSSLAIFFALLVFYSRVQHNAVTNGTLITAGHTLSTSQGMEMMEQMSVMRSGNTPYIQTPNDMAFMSANQSQHSISHLDMTSVAPPSYDTVQSQVRFTQLTPARYYFNQRRYNPVISGAFGTATASVTSSAVRSSRTLMHDNPSSEEQDINPSSQFRNNERSSLL